MWRWRWWLVGLASLFMFVVMNSVSIMTESGVVTDADRQTRLRFALAFAVAGAILVAWFISTLYVVFQRKFKWFFGLLIMPPVALVCMIVCK